jgi:hypothetical protein
MLAAGALTYAIGLAQFFYSVEMCASGIKVRGGAVAFGFLGGLIAFGILSLVLFLVIPAYYSKAQRKNRVARYALWMTSAQALLMLALLALYRVAVPFLPPTLVDYLLGAAAILLAAGCPVVTRFVHAS